MSPSAAVGVRGASLSAVSAACALMLAISVCAPPTAAYGGGIGRGAFLWSYPDGFLDLNGSTYFLADDGSGLHHLWQVVGDPPASARRVTGDIRGPIGLYGRPGRFEGRLYVAGQARGDGGCGLWSSDGAPGGTRRVYEFLPDRTCLSTRQWYPAAFTVVGDRLFFRAADPVTGAELWVTDGTTSGTRLVRNISTAPTGGDDDLSSVPEFLTAVGSILLFAAERADRPGLWRSDGTSDGTFRLAEISPRPMNDADERFAILNGAAIFVAVDDAGTIRLWRSDGSAAGTMPIAAMGVESDLHRERPSMAVWRDRLYFLVNDAPGVLTLWASDGTVAGTAPVVSGPPGARRGAEIVATPDRLFLTMWQEGQSILWRSDGTAAGTAAVTGRVRSVQRLMPFGGQVIFGGTDGTTGCGLWQSDGTDDGTTVLATSAHSGGGCPLPFRHGEGPDPQLASASQAFLGFNEGVTGYEPWTTDGTLQGTRLLIDVNAICAADCNGDRLVTIDEIVGGIAIALGRASLDSCTAADPNGDERVDIAEVISAIGAGLSGCGPDAASP